MDDLEAELNIAHDAPEDDSTSQERLQIPVYIQYQTNEKGAPSSMNFLKTNRKCLKQIRDAMLLHNWQEALVYYNNCIQTLEAMSVMGLHPTTSEIMWRIGTEILRHLPNATAEDFNAVYEQLKNNGVKNFSKICLEHSFHLLLNGQMDEAKRQLSIGQSWKHGTFTIAQGDTKKLIQAYCGFLDYLIWCKKKSSVPGTDEMSRNCDMHSCFRQASVTLKEIISQPGIWDPFVLSFIDMLEFYNDEDGALEVLENYAYNEDFPINPNAHVYLYHFLKRHNAPEAKLIGSLKVLQTLVPSHELMLELCSLLKHTKLMSDLEDAFSISMDLLEFASWKCDIKAWSCLLNIMKILKRKKCKETIKKEWKSRRPLWFPLHFRSYISKKDIVENISLVKVKREVLKIVGEKDSPYCKVFWKSKSKRKTKKWTVWENQ
ncbi:TATA box-binding protein-associated factor RNA polymerase I subunit A-like [Ctenopharyngodon idella]|uniref:TATA box-binding protein-associated factor RNA polymerase I subunit A-like n=1 Tax=Ctenopharyngodon idella TaxID=7959 RepID=UPI00223280DB|nr:TATA box-binding protein-associated factor RNA polymerase I subunit A-like [Ctenopharyngodon idella]